MKPSAPVRLASLCLSLLVALPVVSDRLHAHSPDRVSLTVLTYNIRYDTPADGPNQWQYRRDAMVQYVRNARPDIIGFQEVLPQPRAFLAAQLTDYAWYGVGRDDGEDNGEGTPVFFRRDRFDLLDQGTFWLSPTPQVAGSRGWDAALPRVASWVKLRERQSGTDLLAINTHFDHRGPGARLESARLLLRKIDELASSGGRRLPVILTGDFNCRPGDEPYRALTQPEDASMGLLDAQHLSRQPHQGGDSTLNAFRAITPGGKIDYIFVRDVAGVESHRIEDPRVEDRFVSDHLPLLSDIVLR
jgi:endonuclease/exonuclease/phosphatase family metal-dependent hydrolase